MKHKMETFNKFLLYKDFVENKSIKKLKYWDLIKEMNINKRNLPNISKRRASRGNSPNIHNSTK
jgi:hypothetical protein